MMLSRRRGIDDDPRGGFAGEPVDSKRHPPAVIIRSRRMIQYSRDSSC